MKKKGVSIKFIKGVLIAAMVVFTANMAFAIDPIPKESGFSGYIGPAIGAARYKGNMIAGLNKLSMNFGEETTDSLTEEAEPKTAGLGLLNFEFGYNFASTRTRVFIGSSLEDFIQFNLAQQIGVRQEIGKLGIMSAGFMRSSIPVSVWKDPYMTDVPREDTDRESLGGRFAWDRMFSTGLGMQLDFRETTIDDEQSGIALGLTDAQRQLLDRNGNTLRGKLEYRFLITPKHRLSPTFIYTKNDSDGDAMSNDAYTFQLTYLYVSQPFIFAGNALFAKANYNKANPIPDFDNKTREDDRYGFTGTLFYKNPFGWNWFGSDRIAFYGTVAYAVSDSNINFYNTEMTLGALGIMYRF
jgi:hypothetical protein